MSIEDLKVQERLATEEGHGQTLWLNRVESLAQPITDAVRGLYRHLGDRRVPLAVITLQAVVTGEVALQGRKDGEMQFVRVLVVLDEELV